jgi:glycosyltransferase involved in cell wall biosynthesis
MPVYNGERYLESSIASVLGQSFTDFELIICDNASTDRTASICQDLAAGDSRIRYHRNEVNVGAAGNYNKLVSLARAPYFRWNNADDLLHPDLHQRCYEALTKCEDAVLAAGSTVIIDAEGKQIGCYEDNIALSSDRASERFREFHERIGLTNVIYGLMRTDAMRRTRLMGTGKLPAGDIKFMAELCLYGKFVTIDEPLFYRRMHETASSWDRSNGRVQAEFWSASAGGFSFPYWRSMAHNVGSVVRAPIPGAERRELYKYLARRMYHSKRRLLSELFPRLVASE